MPTKPNMRMGGVDTQGDRGVMAGAMQAAQIKASAQDESGINNLAGNVMDWASDIQKEDRQVRLEERASKRGIAKEKRTAGVLAEQRDYDKPYREAQIGELDARRRKADRWEASTSSSDKVDNKPSGIYLDGRELTLGQAKFFQREYQEIDKELSVADKSNAISAVITTIDEDTGLKGNWLTTKGNAEDFVKLSVQNPDKAKARDGDAYKLVLQALEDNPVYGSTQEFIKGEYGGNKTAATPTPTGRPVRGVNESKADYLSRLKAMRGK